MEVKEALVIGALVGVFNTACTIVPATGMVTSYGAPTYYGPSNYGQSYAPAYVSPSYPFFGPNVYIGPRLGPSYNWGSNHNWTPRNYGPPAHHHGGGHGGGYRR